MKTYIEDNSGLLSSNSQKTTACNIWVSEQQRENSFICLLRLIRSCEKKVIRVFGAFSEAVIITLGCKIFFNYQKYLGLLSWAREPT